MKGDIKFRAILRKEALQSKEYGDWKKPIYFTLEDLIRGKVVFSFPEHWIFNQYAGFKDLNEKEVYEGDIINVYHASEYQDPEYDEENGGKEKRIDYNMNNAFVCKQEVKWSDNGGYFSEEDTGEYCPPLGSSDDVFIEIIGDIYSTPELLK